MSSIFITQAGALELQLAGLSGFSAGGAPAVDLVTSAPAGPGRQAVIGDFTIAAYTGYAEGAPTFTLGLVEGGSGPVYGLSSLLSFDGPSSGPGVVATGFVMQNFAKTKVLCWGLFDTPLPLQTSTDIIQAVLHLDELENNVIVQVAP